VKSFEKQIKVSIRSYVIKENKKGEKISKKVFPEKKNTLLVL